MTTSTYAVTGMTCGHCASAVTSELKTLEGVTDVAVDLVAGGTSSVTVTSTSGDRKTGLKWSSETIAGTVTTLAGFFLSDWQCDQACPSCEGT